MGSQNWPLATLWLIIITRGISMALIYHTRREQRVLYNNTNNTRAYMRTHVGQRVGTTEEEEKKTDWQSGHTLSPAFGDFVPLTSFSPLSPLLSGLSFPPPSLRHISLCHVSSGTTKVICVLCKNACTDWRNEPLCYFTHKTYIWMLSIFLLAHLLIIPRNTWPWDCETPTGLIFIVC